MSGWLFEWTWGHRSWWGLFIIQLSPGREERGTKRKVWEVTLRGMRVFVHVSGVCFCPSVCIWMCLRRQHALLFTQINIWHWLHGLWSAFHPIWTINVSAIHDFVSMDSPQGTSQWLLQSFYNHTPQSLSLIVSIMVNPKILTGKLLILIGKQTHTLLILTTLSLSHTHS